MRCCAACAPGAPDMRRLIERALLSPRCLDAAEWLCARWPLRAVLDAIAARRDIRLRAFICGSPLGRYLPGAPVSGQTHPGRGAS